MSDLKFAPPNSSNMIFNQYSEFCHRVRFSKDPGSGFSDDPGLGPGPPYKACPYKSLQEESELFDTS